MKNEIENLIEDILQENADLISVPASHEAWLRFNHRKKRNLKSIFPLATACFITIAFCITLGLWEPSTANAISNRMLKTVVDIFSSESPTDVSISLSNTTDVPSHSHNAPPDWPLDTDETVVTMEEARANASFTFKIPTFIPKGVKLDIITILNRTRVKQYFRSGDDILIIAQDYIPFDFASNYSFSQAKVKKVKIGNQEATLVSQHNPYTHKDKNYLLWFEDNVKYTIETTLKAKTAIKIASSLQ